MNGIEKFGGEKLEKLQKKLYKHFGKTMAKMS